MSTRGRDEGVQLLHRALDIADMLALRPGLTVVALAEATDIPASSVYRIVQALEARGLIVRSDTRLFAGPHSRSMSESYAHHVLTPWVERARDAVTTLAQQTAASAFLSLPAGTHGLLAARSDSARSPFTAVKTGGEFPMSAGAMGKVLLAYSPRPVRASAVAAATGSRYADGAEVTREHLNRELVELRDKGYWFSADEVQVGTMGISYPVLSRGRVVAGVGVALPRIDMPRRTKERVKALTREAADEIRSVCVPQQLTPDLPLTSVSGLAGRFSPGSAR